MRMRLQSAEASIRAAFESLPPDRRVDPSTGRGNASFAQWCAIAGPHPCWRANVRHHSAGSAIDIDPAANPYIVTRDEPVPHGEIGGPDSAGMRLRALAVYDRALQFAALPAEAADLRVRQPGESTQSVWTRFKGVSDALARYLSFAVDDGPAKVSRAAIENADDVTDDELLATIPEGERLPLGSGFARLENVFASHEFRTNHPGWSYDARAQYLRILRDYEHVRIPMVIGDPSSPPSVTCNPARGFLQIRSEIVTALCDEGLRWGACDFDPRAGDASRNGAMMHFDLADDGGYPEINSLLRFG
jgi:hypothetical protein